MTKKYIIGFALMLILLVPTTSLNANATSSPKEPGNDDKYAFNGAGSTFAFPIIDTWRVEYNKLYPGITLNYQSIGSGAGIKLFKAKTVDFGATDAPLQPSDLKTQPKHTLHIPESIGAIVLTYNLPEYQKNGLKLTGQVIADIYLGKISRWNDPAIAKLNPGVKLSGNTIILVHRSDGSGTTFAFTDYLSKVSNDWKSKVGQGTAVPWPAGMGGAGNAGIAAIVKKVPYSIGYVELAYAKTNKLQSGIPMTYAYVQDHDKNAFLDATVDTIAAAAKGALSSLPASDGDWSKVSINNAPGSNAYPIATFTYLLVNADLDQVKGMDQQKALDLVHMLYWFVTDDGQKFASKLLYVPLPDGVQELDKKGLSEIKFKGQQLWSYP
jgi:phosphate ABC transporter phosphate-binding protein